MNINGAIYVNHLMMEMILIVSAVFTYLVGLCGVLEVVFVKK